LGKRDPRLMSGSRGDQIPNRLRPRQVDAPMTQGAIRELTGARGDRALPQRGLDERGQDGGTPVRPELHGRLTGEGPPGLERDEESVVDSATLLIQEPSEPRKGRRTARSEQSVRNVHGSWSGEADAADAAPPRRRRHRHEGRREIVHARIASADLLDVDAFEEPFSLGRGAKSGELADRHVNDATLVGVHLRQALA
jgi:hypothetical protein